MWTHYYRYRMAGSTEGQWFTMYCEHKDTLLNAKCPSCEDAIMYNVTTLALLFLNLRSESEGNSLLSCHLMPLLLYLYSSEVNYVEYYGVGIKTGKSSLLSLGRWSSVLRSASVRVLQVSSRWTLLTTSSSELFANGRRVQQRTEVSSKTTFTPILSAQS